MDTVCDCCGSELEMMDVCEMEYGEWIGAYLCPDCYAEIQSEEDELYDD